MKKKKLGLLTRLLIGITAGMLIGSAGDIFGVGGTLIF